MQKALILALFVAGFGASSPVLADDARLYIIAPNNGPASDVAEAPQSNRTPAVKSRFGDKRVERHIGSIINMNGKMAPTNR